MKNLCNLGYVRDRGARFPGTCEVDAARFAVTRDREDIVVITFVRERDHRPHDHGTLEYRAATGSFAAPHPDPRVQRQAQAYLRAYLRRKAAQPAARAAVSAASV